MDVNVDRKIIKGPIFDLLRAWGKAIEDERYTEARMYLDSIKEQNKKTPLEMAYGVSIAETFQKIQLRKGRADHKSVTDLGHPKQRLERVQSLKEDLGYGNFRLKFQL